MRILKNSQIPPQRKEIKRRCFFCIAGFTLIEIIIAVVVIAILLFLGLALYLRVTGKAVTSEAIVNLDAIRKAEVMYQAQTGIFTNASSTQEVNERLSAEIDEKLYRYKVVNATFDNFTAIAELVNATNETLAMAGEDQLIVIAMNPDGGVSYGYSGSGGSAGAGSGGGSTVVGGSAGGGFSGGGGSGGSWGGGGFGGGGFGEGGGGGSSGGGSSGGGGTGGGTTSTSGEAAAAAPFSFVTDDVIEALRSTAIGESLYATIESNNLPVLFGSDLCATALGWFTGDSIYICSELSSGWTPEAMAAVLAHEATHADYFYNPQRWIDSTLVRHPELTAGDLSIPLDSIDQEYMANVNGVAVWKEIKGSQTNPDMDAYENLIDQGEDYAKSVLRSFSAYAGLPDY